MVPYTLYYQYVFFFYLSIFNRQQVQLRMATFPNNCSQRLLI